MTIADDLRAFNAGIARARHTYREDRLHADGLCVVCGVWRTAGFKRRCYRCTERKRSGR